MWESTITQQQYCWCSWSSNVLTISHRSITTAALPDLPYCYKTSQLFVCVYWNYGECRKGLVEPLVQIKLCKLPAEKFTFVATSGMMWHGEVLQVTIVNNRRIAGRGTQLTFPTQILTHVCICVCLCFQNITTFVCTYICICRMVELNLALVKNIDM